MGFFDAAKAVLARGDRVSVAVLFQFDFVDETKRFWTGNIPLTTGGESWQGSADVISANGLEAPSNMTAPQATFTLSGVDADLVSFAAASSERVTDQPATTYLQFMTSEGVPLDGPLAFWAGRMDTMTYTGSGAQRRSISLSAESLFTRRIRAANGFYSVRDQQARYPGDTGMQFTAAMVNKTVKFLQQ